MVDILLVDDTPYGLLALEAVLASPEYNLIKAESGPAALAKLYGHDFAVILLDVQMPVMDGFETARLIRKYEPAREIPIIFVTAISKDSHNISRGYESGAVDYLFKPIDPYILRSKVKVFVELYHARQAMKKMNEELEERVRQRTSELVQINKELEQFAYIASHDLQEPLRKIIIFSERLNENSARQLDNMGKDHLERIHKASLRMKTVIEDLLVFSKVNTKELTFEKMDLRQTIQEMLSDLEIKIAQENAKIEIGELPVLIANKSQIRHLFQNLILNAIKFSKKTKILRSQLDANQKTVLWTSRSGTTALGSTKNIWGIFSNCFIVFILKMNTKEAALDFRYARRSRSSTAEASRPAANPTKGRRLS